MEEVKKKRTTTKKATEDKKGTSTKKIVKKETTKSSTKKTTAIKKTTAKKAATKKTEPVKRTRTKKVDKVEELPATSMYPLIDDKTQELVLHGNTEVLPVVEENMIVEEPKKEVKFKKKSRFSFHFGATQRIVMYLIFIFGFLALGVVFLGKAYQFSDGETINYKESYNLDYKVNLKPNEFYETPSLGMNMTYVASIIDTIDINYNYKFDIDKASSVKFTYYTYAVLDITDKNGNSYLSKNYQLEQPQEINIKSGTQAKINKKVSIDYGYYNSLANQFRSRYGINTESKLKVYLKIMKTNENKDLSINFTEGEPFALEIPLSEKSVNININYNAVNDNNEVISRPAYSMTNKNDLVSSICFIVLSLYALICMVRFLIKIQVKKSDYDRIIEKLLREYDRLIVNTSSKPNLHSNKLVKVKEFNELLDVRDTLQLPIMYYEVTKHQKCYFYINQNDMVYLLTLKAIDLENKE